MNTPRTPRFDPVPALALANGTEVHSSTRTALSTNADRCGRRTLTVGSSRLAMHVQDGALVVSFNSGERKMPALMRDMRMRRPRVER